MTNKKTNVTYIGPNSNLPSSEYIKSRDLLRPFWLIAVTALSGSVLLILALMFICRTFVDAICALIAGLGLSLIGFYLHEKAHALAAERIAKIPATIGLDGYKPYCRLEAWCRPKDYAIICLAPLIVPVVFGVITLVTSTFSIPPWVVGGLAAATIFQFAGMATDFYWSAIVWKTPPDHYVEDNGTRAEIHAPRTKTT